MNQERLNRISGIILELLRNKELVIWHYLRRVEMTIAIFTKLHPFGRISMLIIELILNLSVNDIFELCNTLCRQGLRLCG